MPHCWKSHVSAHIYVVSEESYLNEAREKGVDIDNIARERQDNHSWNHPMPLNTGTEQIRPNLLCFVNANWNFNMPPDKSDGNQKLIFLYLNLNICCWYSKELSRWDGAFEHPKHMLKLVDKKICIILRRFYFAYLDPWKAENCQKAEDSRPWN